MIAYTGRLREKGLLFCRLQLWFIDLATAKSEASVYTRETMLSWFIFFIIKAINFNNRCRASQPVASEQQIYLYTDKKFRFLGTMHLDFQRQCTGFLPQCRACPFHLYTDLRLRFVAWSSLRFVEIITFNVSVVNFSFMAYIVAKLY